MREIKIEEALEIEDGVFVDLRSESEYGDSTIPGAINMPLLNDQERIKVGTMYKQVCPEEAKFLGLNLISPKLPHIMNQLRQLTKSGTKVIIFCWRGGMRSKSIAHLAGFVGLPVYRLIGGYKSYRKYINSYFEQDLKLPLVVLHGNTGVGKTDLIETLKKRGFPAINLEGIANNRGSAFGSIGMNPQPSQKMFESLLFNEMRKYKSKSAIVVECESRRIGRALLPMSFYKCMVGGNHILAYAGYEARVQRLIKMYSENGHKHDAQLIDAIRSLKKKLGNDKVEYLSRLVIEGNLEPVVLCLLKDYYDPLYDYPNQASATYQLSVDTDNLDKATDEIISFYQQ